MINRILKFRKWSRRENQWINPARLEIFRRDGILKDLYDPDEEDGTIEQYTNIDDINGRELYQGDCVRTLAIPIPGNIQYIDGIYCICYKQIDDVSRTFLPIQKDIEYLGNIHENPELIKSTI